MNTIITITKSLAFSLIASFLLYGCNKDNNDVNEKIIIDVCIGQDTTIYYGDILILDPGPDYATYLWNDGLSTAQTLPVGKTGKYWVHVTDSLDNMAADTIHVTVVEEFDFSTIPCIEGMRNVVIPISHCRVSFPCDYTIYAFFAEEGWVFGARGQGGKVSFEDARGIVISELLDEWRTSNIRELIYDDNGNMIGVLYYHMGEGFRDSMGFFFRKVNEHYVVTFSVSYHSDYHDEVISILKTLKK